MSFAARYGGQCSKCAGYITPGASVNYDGKAIRHAPRCPAAGTVTEVPPPAPRPDDTVTDATKVLGRATYKGKSGYLILWMGTTKKGEAAKLAFRDGTKVFWADRAEIRVDKTYDHEYRGRIEHMTFGRLNELRTEFAAQKTAEKEEQAKVAKEMADRDAAREAKAAATGKTMAEVIAEEDASRREARKGLKSFTRSGKNSASVGERITHNGKIYEITAIKSYYVSAADLEAAEDMDDFSRRNDTPGWETSFDAREVEPTAAELTTQRTCKCAARLADLAKGNRSSEWAHLPDRSGKLKPEIEAGTTVRERVWSGKYGDAAYRTQMGLLSYHHMYDDSPTWSLLRWEAMTPEDMEIVRAAAVIS